MVNGAESLSDEELFAIAGITPPGDSPAVPSSSVGSGLSDEELFAIAGIAPPPPTPAVAPETIGLPFGINVEKEGLAELGQSFGRGLLSRPAFQGAGGTLGAALGIPLGPGGVLAGGGLGAAGGEAAFNVLQSAGLAPTDVKTPRSAAEAFTRPIKAGVEDVAFAGGLGVAGQAARAVGPTVKKGALKIAGAMTPEAKEVKRMARDLNVPVGSINVTPRDAVRSFAKVAGVFPFVGTPIRKAQKVSQDAIARRFSDILDEMAPTATLADAGIDLTKGAKSQFNKFRAESKALYQAFEDTVDDLPVKDVIDGNIVRNVAEDVIGRQAAGQVQLRTGEALSAPGTDPLGNFIGQLTQLPDNMTIPQLREVQRGLKDVMGRAAADGWDLSRGIEIKKSLEQAMNNPNFDRVIQSVGDNPAIAQQIKDASDALVNANRHFGENMSRFGTATAKKFGRVEKNIFGPGFKKAGSKEPDEIAKGVFNVKSPIALQNLRDVTGEKAFRKAARVQIS